MTRARAILLLAAAGLTLSACAAVRRDRVEPAPPPPEIVIAPPPVVQVQPPPPPAVPQARSCVPRGLGPSPRYPDTDAALRAAPGAADRYQLMAAGRLLRQRRLEELERVIAGCR